MLVLSRKAGEKIRIGDDVVVTVVEVIGGRVRIGVDAPKNVPIIRPDARSQKPKSENEQDPPNEEIGDIAPIRQRA